MKMHELVGMQRAEFNRAARLRVRYLVVQIAIALMAALAVFIDDPVWTYLGAIGAAVLAVLCLFIGNAARESRAQAERTRRATLLMDGLGQQVSPNELLDLRANFTVTPEQGKAQEDPKYYATRKAPGDQRLAEMLEESAFWSADLMQKSAWVAWAAFAIYVTVGLTMLFASLPFMPVEKFQSVVRVFCALLTLTVSTDVLGAAFSYRSAAWALSKLLPRIDAARNAGYPRADLLMLMLDYNSAVEGAQLYPPGVYSKRRSTLNELWSSRMRASKRSAT